MILEKIWPCLLKLELGFWTYGWILPLGSSGPNVITSPSSEGQDIFRKFIIYLDSSHDSGENEVLFVKTGARVLDLLLDMSSGSKWP